MKGMKNMKKSGAQTFMTRNPKHAGRQALSFLAFMSFMTFIVMPFLSASQTPKKGITDWPMWGGSPDRNMVSDATGLPTDWDVKTGTCSRDLDAKVGPAQARSSTGLGATNDLASRPMQPMHRSSGSV